MHSAFLASEVFTPVSEQVVKFVGSVPDGMNTLSSGVIASVNSASQVISAVNWDMEDDALDTRVDGAWVVVSCGFWIADPISGCGVTVANFACAAFSGNWCRHTPYAWVATVDHAQITASALDGLVEAETR